MPTDSPARGTRAGLSPEGYRRITLLALASLVVIVVTGAAVRLTGSGLGCSDWPTCEKGQLAPADIRDAPAMVEFTNRTITGIVSVAVILAVLGSLARRPRRPDLTRLSVGLVAGVLAQIVLGGLVVLLDLSPRLVMAHFALSMVIVWNAVVLHHRAGLPDTPDPARPPGTASHPDASHPGAGHPGAGDLDGDLDGERRTGAHPQRPWGPRWGTAPGQLARVARAAVALAGVVVLTGTVVTAAGPHAGDEQASRLGLDIVTAARVHGIAVMALLASVLVAALLARNPEVAPGVGDRVSRLLAVLVAQGAVGYTQYFTHVPPLLVGIHICGALAVWISTLQLQLATTASTPVPRDHRSPVAA